MVTMLPLTMTPVLLALPVTRRVVVPHRRVVDLPVLRRRVIARRWRRWLDVSRRRHHDHSRQPDSNANRPVRCVRVSRQPGGSNTQTNYRGERIQSAHDKPSSHVARESDPTLVKDSQRVPHTSPVSRPRGELGLNAARASWKGLSRQAIAKRPASAVESLTERGCSSMVELQLPKLLTWVRFPSPAPASRSWVASLQVIRAVEVLARIPEQVAVRGSLAGTDAGSDCSAACATARPRSPPRRDNPERRSRAPGHRRGTTPRRQMPHRVARSLRAASTIADSAAFVSGQPRVFKPQSGLTQSWSAARPERALCSKSSISSALGTRGEWMS